MKRPSLLLISLFIVFFLTSISYAKHHIRHNFPQNPAKPKTSTMQKQLVKNAKTVLKTFGKDLQKRQSSFRKAKKTFNQAQKEHNAALKKMRTGNTAEKSEGRIALSTTSRKLVDAENALYEARSAQTRASTQYADAKTNLNGLRKEGWQRFFANQRNRATNSEPTEPSIQLPRAQRNSVDVVDSKQYRKALVEAEFKHAYKMQ